MAAAVGTAALGVIGFLGDVVTIVPFALSLFASRRVDEDVFRIFAAFGSAPDEGTTGFIDQIRTYNVKEEWIGRWDGNTAIDNGPYSDIAAMGFILMSVSPDPICISHMTVTCIDGTNWGWPGDWGWACGQDWHWSNIVNNGKGPAPSGRCMWLDADQRNGIKAASIKIHWPTFHEQGTPKDKNARNRCGKANGIRVYDLNEKGVAYPARKAKPLGNVVRIKRKADRAGRLVVSDIPHQTASELCQSETSKGPYFVSVVEGLFCNMETSKLLPLCAKGTDSSAAGCFHLDIVENSTNQTAIANPLNPFLKANNKLNFDPLVGG
ncbi:hypothetical protein QBC38DRAFT_378219 [Podospora fimiseda]|uniref:Uncharacterized protein n=1 Tax=Podospora fimiseda TaxID=252190 RepID=A0AAN7BEC6_9PEZI|nr:hypothetical protein QBC38DRAFT_378219 [Podospora fimiseda]